MKYYLLSYDQPRKTATNQSDFSFDNKTNVHYKKDKSTWNKSAASTNALAKCDWSAVNNRPYPYSL